MANILHVRTGVDSIKRAFVFSINIGQPFPPKPLDFPGTFRDILTRLIEITGKKS